MSEAAPHPTGPTRGTGALLLRLFIWLFVLLAGFAMVIVLPMILVLTAMAGEGRPGHWSVYVWVPIVFLAALYSVVRGLQAMAHPRPRKVALLGGIALAAFLSFPPFWLPEL